MHQSHADQVKVRYRAPTLRNDCFLCDVNVAQVESVVDSFDLLHLFVHRTEEEMGWRKETTYDRLSN